MIPNKFMRQAALDAVDRAVHTLESREQTSSRRTFLHFTATSLGAALLAACNSSGPESAARLLAYSTKKNESVERWLFRHTAMDHPSSGAVIAGNQFPNYFVADVVPKWNAAERGPWALEISGLVKTPMKLDFAALMALPSMEQRVDHFCVEGWNAVAKFRGVAMQEIVKLAGVLPQASVVDFQSFDADYHESWDIESATHPQTMVVYAKDGDLLSPAFGAPARVHSPVKLGYKNTKYLTRIVFLAERNGGYWTDKGYDWYGGT